MRTAPPPVIVLVRPQLAENIGATARAMVNFGARELRVVNPQPYDEIHAARMACDGRLVLERMKRYPDLRSALADCAYTVATSRRLRRIKIAPLEPRAAMAKLLTFSSPARTAVVFGAEQAGLTNEELFLCDVASAIPTSDQGSLNLGQAVLLYLYEWFLAAHPDTTLPLSLDRPATHAEKQRSYDLLGKLLRASDYKPLSRLPEFMRRVKLLFETRPLSFREQKILLKALRYLEKITDPPPPARTKK